MAMGDWNGNGNKNDVADNFMEYQIYKDCINNNSTPRRNTNTSGSSFGIVIMIACVVQVFCGWSIDYIRVWIAKTFRNVTKIILAAEHVPYL